MFQLVGECAAEEGGGSVIIHIVKEGNVSLANSVTLSITPLTIEDAEGRVSLLDIPPANDLSPNRAGMTRSTVVCLYCSYVSFCRLFRL